MYVKLIAGAVVLLIVYLGYSHYKSLIDDKVRLEKNIAVQETAIQLKDQQIRASEKAIISLAESNAALQATFSKAAEIEKKAVQVLVKHDIDKLIQRKPITMKNKIQKGTDNVFKDFETAFNQ